MKNLVLLTLVVILGVAVVSNAKSKVEYVDTPCPNCCSTEILDFGMDDNGNQKCHCADCNQEFTIENL